MTHYSVARFPVADTYLTQFSHSDAGPGKAPLRSNQLLCIRMSRTRRSRRRVRTGSGSPAGAWAQAQQNIMDAVCVVPISRTCSLWAWTDRPGSRP